MKRRISFLTCLTVAALLGYASVAEATTTLGTVTQPSGSTLAGCGSGVVINQVNSDPAVPFSVPGTGTITQWQINTSAGPDTPGAAVALVVLRPAGSGFQVVGVDSKNVPSPLPSGGVATYAIASPIAVQAGDTFGLYTNNIGAVVCYWHGGSTPAAANLAQLSEPSPPAANQSLSRTGSDSPGGYEMALTATFEPPAVPAPAPAKKKCKKKHKRSAESAKKCKKKKG